MWFTFVLCMLACALVLYLPGTIACRALGLQGACTLACAPLASVALIALICIVYGVAAIPCTALSVLAPATIIPLAACGICAWVRSQGGKLPRLSLSPTEASKTFDYATLLLYIAIGAIVCTYVYLKSLDGPESFYARHDNITHLNLVRSYLDSGVWSTLQTSNYLASPDYAVSRTGGSFYPAAWHDLAALVCSLTRSSVPMGINAVNAVVAAAIYPSSMWVLMRALFPENRGTVLWGALATMAFTAFPWTFFTKGPLYSNLLAFALMPATLGVIVGCARQSLSLRKAAIPLIGLGLASFVALAFSQPNSLFTVFVFLACLGGKCLWEAGSASHWSRPAVLRAIAYLCGVIALWLVLFKLPFLQAVIWFEWPKAVRLTSGLFRTLTLSFTAGMPQVALVIITAIGIATCVAKRRAWLLLPVAFFAIAYILSATTNGLPKHLLGGFWYTDPVRLAACTTLFLVPIASCGLWAVTRAAAALLNQAVDPASTRHGMRATACVLAIAFCLCNFFPSYYVPGHAEDGPAETPFGRVKQRIATFYDMRSEKVYDADEQAFVREVMHAIPAGALVLNQPNDGSVFAYGLDNLNTYYRQITHEGETESARIIREHLDDIADDPTVQQAVRETGAQYVLLLDQGVSRKEGTWLAQYKDPESWRGIDSITDETPGFKKILADGEMRLYEIE